MIRQQVKTIDQVEQTNTEDKEATDKRTEDKVLRPEYVEELGLYRVVYTSGGEVPDVLKGHYTSLRIVNAAIANHNYEQEKLK